LKKLGFTLIEMMVVLFVIGILSTVTVMSINAPSFTRFLTKAEQLSQSLAILSDEAIYSNSLISCKLYKQNITCRSYTDGEWVDMDLRRTYSWGWPENLVIKQVLINEIPINSEKTPINFDPSGDNELLAIEVTDGVYTVWIYGDLAGKYWVSS
jgi:prepilin-type N-terminal cleavage/methylation domain-containing protein